MPTVAALRPRWRIARLAVQRLAVAADDSWCAFGRTRPWGSIRLSAHFSPAVRWHIRRTQFPLVHRRCGNCPGTELAATGRFRVNANGNLIDVWLLLRCRHCGATTKVPVLERASVRSIPPDRLDGFTRNDAALICWALREAAANRRRRMRLDWTGAWKLTGVPATRPVTVEVKFCDPISLRAVQIIATGLGISHGEVYRRLQAQTLTLSVAPDARRVEDFSFHLA